MKKYRLWIEENHKCIYEVEAQSVIEAAKICLSGGKVIRKDGIVEATIKRSEEIQDSEAPTEEAVKKFDPLDKTYVSN